MKRIYLSYPLGEETPRFAENPPVSMWSQFSTDRGDVFNQSFYMTINHAGTHMDGANHFNPKGKQLWENEADTFVYENVLVLDIPKTDDELIYKKDLEVYENELKMCDFVIVRTGFYKVRDDAYRYGQHNPGFTKEAGDFLMQFPSIKAIGMDIPSAAGAQNVDPHGIEFHQSVLGLNRTDERAILIIEDMKLDADLRGISKVYALPLLLKGLDSGPCTIIAEF